MKLPDKFSDLEPYAKWASPTVEGRLALRLQNTYEDMEEFYNAMLPRIEDVLQYLNEFDMDKLPEKEETLFHLALSFTNAIQCVEYFKDTRVPAGFEHERMTMCLPSAFF